MATSAKPLGTAVEIVEHRQPSPIRSLQRHFRLDPPLDTQRGVRCDIVVIPGANATYAFVGDDRGEVENFTALVTHPASESGESSVLEALGYRIAS